MPALRGHHLICLQFYHGEGYDKAFIENLERVMDQVRREGVSVSPGSDDVCAACLHLREGLCQYSPEADEEIRGMDRKAMELLGLSVGMDVEWDAIRESIPSVFRQWYDSFCRDCSWRRFCEKDEAFLSIKKQQPPFHP
jgi:hypothetical protein